MASNTPKKSVCEEIHNHCRCCNNENRRHILLYGDKAKAEGLVETIIRLTELHISENDNLSKWICRNCAGKIQTLAKNLDELKTLCKDTVQKQQKELASARMKRGRKETSTIEDSPPSATAPLGAPKRTRVSESRASRSLSAMFQNIAPKPSETQFSSEQSHMHPSVHPQPIVSPQQGRSLPASLSRTTTASSTASDFQVPPASEKVSLLSSCTLQALEVVTVNQ